MDPIVASFQGTQHTGARVGFWFQDNRNAMRLREWAMSNFETSPFHIHMPRAKALSNIAKQKFTRSMPWKHTGVALGKAWRWKQNMLPPHTLKFHCVLWVKQMLESTRPPRSQISCSHSGWLGPQYFGPDMTKEGETNPNDKRRRWHYSMPLAQHGWLCLTKLWPGEAIRATWSSTGWIPLGACFATNKRKQQ